MSASKFQALQVSHLCWLSKHLDAVLPAEVDAAMGAVVLCYLWQWLDPIFFGSTNSNLYPSVSFEVCCSASSELWGYDPGVHLCIS